MTPEEKQLLLIDLCARLPYGIKVHFDNGSKNGRDFVLDELSDLYIYWIEYFKPYLRPMSSMTSKEWLEYCDACVEDEKSWVTAGKELRFFPVNHKVEFLNAHHFDHRGLIEKGLALEAKKGMYKTE